MKILKFFKIITSKNYWKASLILVLGIVLTLIYTRNSYNNVEKQNMLEYKEVCNNLKTKIELRLHAHAEILRGGSAFFESVDTVTRQQWGSYNKKSHVDVNLAGIEGVGFSLIIAKEQLRKHINQMQREGFPDYAIYPSGDRELYTSIIFLEPFTKRNKRAFGYDMFSEPVRRKAMELARDSDIAALTGKVLLVQEKAEDIQAGTLMYVPVYKKGMPKNTIDQRKAAIKGWVYSPYRMDDLMRGILGNEDSLQDERIHLQVFDENISENSLLYDSQRKDSLFHKASKVRLVSMPFEFNGRKWILNFTEREVQEVYFQDEDEVFIVFISGIAISLSLFLLALSIFSSLSRAEEIAEELTKDLKESEERFKNMFKNHASIMLLIEPESNKIVEANNAASKFYGYSIAELCEMHINQINTLSSEQIALESSMANIDKRNHFIFPHKLASGEERIVEVHSSPIDYGKNKMLFSIIHDITDRKQAEELISKISKEQQVILDTVPFGVSLIVNRKVEWSNAAHDIIFGYIIGESQGLDTSVFYCDLNSYNKLGEASSKRFMNGEKYTAQLQMRKKNGAIFWCNLEGQQINLDHPEEGLIWIMQDITESKKVKEVLKESQDRWKFALEGAGDGIWDWNLQTNEVYFSKQWKAMLGFEENEISNNLDAWHKGVHPDDIEKCFADIQLHLDGKVTLYSNIHRELCKDGSYKWILDRGKIVTYDENNKPIKMVGTHADITKRMEMEDQLVKLNADKDRFISILAHDLKSPFNSILGFLGLLTENVRSYDIDRTEKFLNLINASAKSTFCLLEDILMWGRANSGKLPYEPQMVSLSYSCNGIIENLELTAKNKNISLNYFSNGEIFVFADSNMLNTILRNLISNAIKFTNENGKITINAEQDSSNVTITVTDNGVGIKDESLSKLFDISEKISTKGTANETGTGIGLLLSKEFVEKHSGKIWAESEFGKGSKFIFTFPLGNKN
jgi:PAS domain S-box-containing protein